MKIKLNELNAEMTHNLVEENDVFVDLDYHQLDVSLIQFFLYAYVGKDKNNYRLCVKTIYMVDLENDRFEDDSTFVKKVLNEVIEPLIEMIIMIDKPTKIEKERLH